MAAVGTLTIEMAANVARLQRDMDRATKTVGGAMDRIQRSVQGATRALGVLTAAFATVKSIQGIVQQADAMTQLNSRLRLVTTSQEEFAKIQGALISISQRTYTSIGATVDLYTALARSTKDVGVSQNELLRVVETFNKAIIISGGSVQAAEAAITQFNQAMASGVLRGEEFNSISEQAPMIMEILANQLGVTRGALRDMAKEGLLVADLVLPALIDGSKGVDEQYGNMSNTVGQATVNLGQSIAILINQIDQSTGFTRALAESIKFLESTIRGLSGIVDDNRYALMAWAGVFLAPAVVTGITTLIASLAALRVAILGITAALAANPIGLALLALTAAAVPAINAMNEYFVAQDKAKQSQDGFNETAAETNRLLRQNEEAAKSNNEAVMSTARARLEQAKADKIAEDAAKELKKAYDNLLTTLRDNLRSSTAELQAEQQGLNKAQEEFLELVSGPQWKQYSAAQKMIIADLFKQRIETEQLIDLEKKRAKAAEDRLKKMLADEKEFREELKKEDEKLAAEKLKKEQEFYAEQRREIEKIGDQLTDSLMRAFESGKGFGQAFKDTLVNMFRTMVLRPILAPISGAMAGVFGGGQAMAAGGAGGAGSLGALGGLAAGASAFGSYLATGFMNTVAGTGFGASMTAAGSLMSGGSIAGGAGMAVGAALPYVAAAYAVYKLTQGDGKDPTGRGAFVSTRDMEVTRGLIAETTGFKTSSEVVNDFFDRANDGLKPVVETVVNGIMDTTQARARAIGLDIALGIDAGLVTDPEAKQSYGYASIFMGGERISNIVERSLGKDFEQATQKFSQILQEEVAQAVLDAGNVLVPAGQTASQVLERLGSSILAVNQTFDTLGLTMFDTSIAGAEMAAALVDILGGVENFTALSAQYYQNFYTEAERTEELMRKLTASFGDLGLNLPGTRDEFRALIEAQDLSTESGRQLFAALMQLNPAFSTLVDSAEAMLQEATTAYEEQQARMQAIQEQEAAAIALKIQNAYNDAATATNLALSLVQRSIEAQKKSLELSAQIAEEQVDNIQSVFDVLNSAILDLTGGGFTAITGQSFIQQALLAAQTSGYLPDPNELSRAISAVRGGLTGGSFGSAFEARREQALFVARLTQLREFAGDQLSTAEQTLQGINLQIAQLDEQLTAAQEQVNVLRNIDTGIKDIPTAVAALQSALTVELQALKTLQDQQATQPATTTTTSTTTATTQPATTVQTKSIYDLYKDVLNRAPDAAGYAYWSKELGSTVEASEVGKFLSGIMPGSESLSMSEIQRRAQAFISTLPATQTLRIGGFAAGGMHSGGLRLVGERGPELEMTGPAKYMSNANLSTMMNGGSEDIKQLREENKVQMRALVSLQNRMTKVIERWNIDGLPNERVEA